MKLYRCHFTNTCSASRKALRNASCLSMSFHESLYNRSTTHKKRSWHYLYYEPSSQLLFVVSLDTISVSDHGVEDTGRGSCCVIQLRSGFSPLNRHDTASTSSGNVGRPRSRQGGRKDKARAAPRLA